MIYFKCYCIECHLILFIVRFFLLGTSMLCIHYCLCSYDHLSCHKTHFTSSTYSCLDAQFYDDETVTVILKDTVGREGRDRLLVQLPLSSVYNCEGSAEYQFTGNYSTR